MNYVSSASGGLGSWAAAKLIASEHGTDCLRLLFADTLIESDGLYRFLIESAANVLGVACPESIAAMADSLPSPEADMPGRKAALAAMRDAANAYFGGRLVWLADGRTPWEVYRDERFLGNSRVDPCSKILKRQLLDRWFEANCPRPTTHRVVGLGWWERHRFEGEWTTKVVDGERKRVWKPGLQQRMADRGWTFIAPLIAHKPTLDRYDLRAWAEREGLTVSAAYDDGFEHDNCGGRCSKAGQSHWLRMFRTRPEAFAGAEREEAALRDLLGDVAMMSERKKGKKYPLPLATFRQRIEAGDELCLVGGLPCGCFSGTDERDE